MRDLCQRFGLWLAQQAGWSNHEQVATLTQQVEAASRDQEMMQAHMVALQGDCARYQEQIMEHLKTITSLNQRVTLQKLLISPDCPVTEQVLMRTVELTEGADTSMIGGEAKRHMVYARLIKEFPDVNKRALAFGIEYALSGKGR